MGAGISNFEDCHESGNRTASRVIAFQSESQWLAHLEASKATTKLMVLYFTATWCGPCRWMEPAVNELAEKFPDVEFIKIDVDKLENVATQFEVEAMPTFLFVRNGAVVDRIVGANKSELQKKVVLHRNNLIIY
ncbi:hypothetical protein MLD38_008504 [Melastoma candidum]|uniref:Uncharacterized protein n=1 Tax=Melastoma candidum TaxID=119954 RepID=A0ACB9RVW3_9MYRT|nr:hypothetical protein MLD38_008504 [Melastoma candidum]